MHLSKTKSNSLKQPSESVSEIAIDLFTRLLRDHFAIFNEIVPGRQVAVRYSNEPARNSQDEALSMVVYPHNKGTMVGPLIIFSVLRKFDISIEAYNEAIVAGPKQLPKAANE